MTDRDSLTQKQRELARHALGLPNKRKTSYRNHFVAGPGHDDFDQWCAMVEVGHATRRKGGPLTGGDDLFMLTKIGATAALASDDLLLSVLGSRDMAEAYRDSAISHLRTAAAHLGYDMVKRDE